MPAGDLAEEARRRIFNSLKALLIPNILFEQFGFTYFGPVDGHDLFAVESVLEKARDFRDGPILVHVQTQKGHGYGPAEDDNVKWHGVSAAGAASQARRSTRRLADTVRDPGPDPKTADHSGHAGRHRVAAALQGVSGWLIDVGICEQHASRWPGSRPRASCLIVAITDVLQARVRPGASTTSRQDLDARDDRAARATTAARIRVCTTSATCALSPHHAMAPRDERDLRHMLWTAHRHAAGRGSVGLRFPRTGVARRSTPLREIPMGTSETLKRATCRHRCVRHPANAAFPMPPTRSRATASRPPSSTRASRNRSTRERLLACGPHPRFVTVEERRGDGLRFGGRRALSERGARGHRDARHPRRARDHGAQGLWRHH
jgi:1-deoxy-D-xylulose-5-phosphate synthase